MANIAIVDDNLQSCQLLGRLLREAGHIAIWMTGGERLVDSLREMQPDLLVLDVWMPEMNGLQLLEKIRLEAELAKVPVIFFSAAFDPHIMAEAFRLGAADFIIKSLDWESLLERIERQLPQK